MNLPQSFIENMSEILGPELDEYLESYEKPKFTGLRVNTSKISVEEFERINPFKSLRRVPWTPNGYYYTEEDAPTKHPYYYAGLYYIQEPSAMTPASVLPIEEGERVLDLCAAPGGKATELGAKLNHTGLLVANDASASRTKALLKNLEVFGLPNILVTSEMGDKLDRYFHEYFDKILIDAPCSGEGMFRKQAHMIPAWERQGPEVFSKMQREILDQAANLLKPGGTMLYSTCTFDPKENEQVIEHLLKTYPEFRILKIAPYEGFVQGMPEVTESRDPSLADTVRIFPHKMKGEGHYLALVQKGEPCDRVKGELTGGKGKKKLPEELEEFLNDVKKEIRTDLLDIHGERVYVMPAGLPNLKGLRFLRTGLLLGELKKKRFEPSQAFAMTLKKDDYEKIVDLPLEDDRVSRYLKGETLDVDDLVEMKAKGWYLVCVDGYPLGWGKLANGTLKNKYLPGWRLNS